MKKGFKEMRVQYIQIEENTNLATVEVEIVQDKILIDTTLLLGTSDMNQLLGKLSQKGIEISLSDDFDTGHSINGRVHTLDFYKKGWDEVVIEDFQPRQYYRQIRA